MLIVSISICQALLLLERRRQDSLLKKPECIWMTRNGVTRTREMRTRALLPLSPTLLFLPGEHASFEYQ